MNFTPLKTGLGLCCLLLLNACASLDKEECQTVNWGELGRADGAKGYSSTRLGDHVKACREYGIEPNAQSYQAGREEGLRVYCTEDNAFKAGKENHTFNNVCPASIAPLLQASYRDGQVIYDIESEITAIQNAQYQERQKQSKTKDLAVYKLIEVNLKFLDLELQSTERALNDATDAIARGKHPLGFIKTYWQNRIPYPDAGVPKK